MLAEDIRHPERQPIVFKRRSDKIYKIKRQSKDPSWEGSLKKERFPNTRKLSLASLW